MQRINVAGFEAHLLDDCVSPGALAELDASIKQSRQEQAIDQEGEALEPGSVILSAAQVEIETLSS